MREVSALFFALPTLGRLILLVFSFSCLPSQTLAQSDEETRRVQLEQLERDIKRINQEISEASDQRNTLQEQLRKAEVELGSLQPKITENQRSLDAGTNELATLKQRRDELEHARDEQQARIALELKTAWQMGRQGQVKILLNQESPHTVARSLAYYRYFFKARNTLLDQYRETLRELENLKQRIDATLAQLKTDRQTLQLQKIELTAAQKKRELAVANLSASISSGSAQLKQKEQDREKLEDLLQAIEQAVVKLEMPSDYNEFQSAKGKMPWPLQGKPSNHFGRWRTQGKMRWHGVTIPAKEGSPVKAIHHGRVVYADWLRGSGLLLIIDHGDGYMSLYAHNESLLRNVGEWVTAGTPISTVGNTGGKDKTALYFEVRHKGKPTNPANWCEG